MYLGKVRNCGRFSCPASKYNKATHVIFDLDGLILDSELIYKAAISEIGKRFGKIYTNEMAGKVIGAREIVSSQIAVKEMKLPLTAEQFAKEFRAKTDAMFRAKPTPLMKGAERLITHFSLHKVPICVATSSHASSFEIKTKNHFDLMRLFHHIVMGGDDPDVKEGKPAPDVFLVAASRFQDPPKPNKCLVFEDAPNGVAAALSAGMQCVIVPDKNVPEELYKDATLKLNSLLDFQPEWFGLPAMTQDFKEHHAPHHR